MSRLLLKVIRFVFRVVICLLSCQLQQDFTSQKAVYCWYTFFSYAHLLSDMVPIVFWIRELQNECRGGIQRGRVMPTLSDQKQQTHGREMVQGFGWFRYLITESRAGKSGAEGRTSVCLFKNVGIISMGRLWQAAVQILLACCLQIS